MRTDLAGWLHQTVVFPLVLLILVGSRTTARKKPESSENSNEKSAIADLSNLEIDDDLQIGLETEDNAWDEFTDGVDNFKSMLGGPEPDNESEELPEVDFTFSSEEEILTRQSLKKITKLNSPGSDAAKKASNVVLNEPAVPGGISSYSADPAALTSPSGDVIAEAAAINPDTDSPSVALPAKLSKPLLPPGPTVMTSPSDGAAAKSPKNSPVAIPGNLKKPLLPKNKALVPPPLHVPTPNLTDTFKPNVIKTNTAKGNSKKLASPSAKPQKPGGVLNFLQNNSSQPHLFGWGLPLGLNQLFASPFSLAGNATKPAHARTLAGKGVSPSAAKSRNDTKPLKSPNLEKKNKKFKN